MTSNITEIEAEKLLTNPDHTGIIGSGRFGKVRLCKTRELQEVVVKCFLLDGNRKELDGKLRRLKYEAQILHVLAHKHIVKVHGFCVWPCSFGIVTEYLQGGNLDSFIKNRNLSIVRSVRLRIAVQLSEAICFLHTYEKTKVFVHGDIKPENILLTIDLVVKLADFGSVNVVRETGASTLTAEQPNSKQHTSLFTAPEFLNNVNALRTAAMDVYSFGMVLYEIITRKSVYEGASVGYRTLLQVIRDTGLRPDLAPVDEIRQEINKEDEPLINVMVTTMRQSWAPKPEQRMSMRSVLKSLQDTFCKLDDQTIQNHVEQLLQTSDFKSKCVDENRAVNLDRFRHPFEIVSDLIGNGLRTQNTPVVESTICNMTADEDSCDDATSFLPYSEARVIQKNKCLPRSIVKFSCIIALRLLLIGCIIGIAFHFLSSQSTSSPEAGSLACPLIRTNSLVDKSCTKENSISSTCSFTCTNGRELVGNSSITCEPYSTWSSLPPSCNKTCPKCFTGPKCEYSTSWKKLVLYNLHSGPWTSNNVNYGGFNIKCDVNHHGGINWNWDCQCTDELALLSFKCYNQPSPGHVCEDALNLLIKFLANKTIYLETCDSLSMPDVNSPCKFLETVT